MTESEAKKEIEHNVFCNTDNFEMTISKECYKTIINALEKQIPKKPIFDFNSSDTLSRFHCTCGKIIWVHHDIGTMDNNDAPNYCSNCGLKFDWNE